MGKLIQSPCYLPIIAATALLWSFSAKADEPNLVTQNRAPETSKSTDQSTNASHRTSSDKSSNSADGTAQSNTTSSAVETPAQLGEITVTAQKRKQRFQDVPESASVLTARHLKRQHAIRFEDYISSVPGFNYTSSRQGQTQLIIRGITSGSNQGNSTVATYINDVPFGSSTVFARGSALTPDLDTADLKRITVLRGPQGTLYGASSMGGLVKFVTVPPDTTGYAGRIELNGKTVNDGGLGYGVRGMANVPLVSNKLALRVNAYKRDDPGFIDDAGRGKTDVNDTKVSGGRVSMLWKPTDTISLKLWALAQNLNSNGTNSEDVDRKTLKPIYGDLQQRQALGTGHFDAKYRLYAATLNADLGWSTLVSSTSYSTLREDNNEDVTPTFGPVLRPALGNPNLGFSFLNPIDQHKITQEVRLQSPSKQPLEWLGGVFFTHEHSGNHQTVLGFDARNGAPVSLPQLGATSVPTRFTEYAAYGDLTYHFTPRFDVTVGGRYSHNKQHFMQLSNTTVL